MNDCAQIIGLSGVISAITNTVVTLCFTAYKANGYSLPLLIFYLSFVPVEGMIIYLSGKFNRKWTFAVNKLSAEQSQLMKEILDNVKLARVFNGVNAAMTQFTNILQRRYRQDAYINYVRQFGFSLSLQLVSNVFGLSLMIIASRMIVGRNQFPPFTGSISYGSYSAFRSYADTLKSSLSSLTSLYVTIITICTVAQTLCIFLYRKPQGGSEIAQGPGIVVEEGHEALDCTIRFQNVKFSYPSRPKVPVLKGFTVTFPPKKFTCVIGNSGSGKSTLLMLILRMYVKNIARFIYTCSKIRHRYEPASGNLYLGKHELPLYNITWLRDTFAYDFPPAFFVAAKCFSTGLSHRNRSCLPVLSRRIFSLFPCGVTFMLVI
jgi:ABC-type multidrug transport system fused ATPase/permease subunit